MEKYVTPSLLNVDKSKRAVVAQQLLNNGIKWIHYDIMDGKFVTNHAIEVKEIVKIKQDTSKHIMDAHLMVVNPQSYADQLIGIVDYVTIHFEALNKVQILDFIKKNKSNFKIGLAIKPQTSVDQISDFIPLVDLILVMSVEPGAGGQTFQMEAIDKVHKIKKNIIEQSLSTLIQVDGGINQITGPLTLKAGADAIVAGTYLVFEPTKTKIASLLTKSNN